MQESKDGDAEERGSLFLAAHCTAVGHTALKIFIGLYGSSYIVDIAITYCWRLALKAPAAKKKQPGEIRMQKAGLIPVVASVAHRLLPRPGVG